MNMNLFINDIMTKLFVISIKLKSYRRFVNLQIKSIFKYIKYKNVKSRYYKNSTKKTTQ